MAGTAENHARGLYPITNSSADDALGGFDPGQLEQSLRPITRGAGKCLHMRSGARAGLAQNMAPGLAEQFGRREGDFTRNPSVTGRAPHRGVGRSAPTAAELCLLHDGKRQRGNKCLLALRRARGPSHKGHFFAFPLAENATDRGPRVEPSASKRPDSSTRACVPHVQVASITAEPAMRSLLFGRARRISRGTERTSGRRAARFAS